MIAQTQRAEVRPPVPSWTFVTSHCLTLLYVATHPDATTREISDALDITERRVNDLIHDLSDANLVVVTRRGRRNNYAIDANARFRHPMLANIPFKAFLDLWDHSHASNEKPNGRAMAPEASLQGINQERLG